MVNNQNIRPVLTPSSTENAKESFLPMLHGKATDAIARMDSKSLEPNQLNNTASVSSNEVKLVVSEFDKMTGTLGISTHKLLSTAIANFTGNNHTGSGKRELRSLKVVFPLKEYALLCGYDVEPHETSTPEEAEAEAKRAKSNLDKARRKISKDLTLLFNSSISWEEKIKGKSKDFIDLRIIGAKGIKNGNIYMSFTQEIGEYLVQLPLTQYPTALLSVEERNPNAYIIGLKMAEHFNMDNNQIRETAQLLKVSTLLSVTNLPSIDNSTVKRKGWKTALKEPLENALDALTACGLLKDWEYTHSKGVAMTDEEATSFMSYEEWANTLVHFTLADAPDHTARIEARKEERKKTAKKRGAKKKGGTQ